MGPKPNSDLAHTKAENFHDMIAAILVQWLT